jgi:hypothetical protein
VRYAGTQEAEHSSLSNKNGTVGKVENLVKIYFFGNRIKGLRGVDRDIMTARRQKVWHFGTPMRKSVYDGNVIAAPAVGIFLERDQKDAPLGSRRPRRPIRFGFAFCVLRFAF